MSDLGCRVLIQAVMSKRERVRMIFKHYCAGSEQAYAFESSFEGRNLIQDLTVLYEKKK